MRFALVIPVLNEEGAVEGTLTRALAARQKVLAETPVTEMRVVLVNDGSTDRTQEIVDQPQFDEVLKVKFDRNRGYGAAIQAGWRRCGDAELLGFIDGDGTCNPDFAVPLINHLLRTEADVVLMARLNPQSQMPFIRKVGNWLFARLLGVLARQKLTDCASGFRIVRRRSLPHISPLPIGLHFTPAMSAICLLDPRLRIEEVPLPYQERVGRSKLRVIKDGVRFLYIILFTTCCYGPLKTMLAAAALWLGLVLLPALLLLRAGGAAPATEMLAEPRCWRPSAGVSWPA
jgi:glycosyltransferase involved in cell wall biosynthesis